MSETRYHDGQRERTITKAQLAHIKSHVVTHEGEHLSGKQAQKYMDKYSAKYLGKNLSGSYKRQDIA